MANTALNKPASAPATRQSRVLPAAGLLVLHLLGFLVCVLSLTVAGLQGLDESGYYDLYATLRYPVVAVAVRALVPSLLLWICVFVVTWVLFFRKRAGAAFLISYVSLLVGMAVLGDVLWGLWMRSWGLL